MSPEANYSDIAVLIPCYNEELTVAKVVTDFRQALPGAAVYVFDNNSKDRTAELARGAGAQVIPSPRQGKGHVVRHMFDAIEAQWYVMVDGDDTYPAAAAGELVALARKINADMIVGARMENFGESSFRRFHRFGNHLVASLISRLFGVSVTDVLSGYRVFSRSFVKTAPLLSHGFEIETEMTLQAAAKGFVIQETPVQYGSRPEGSFSKLNTYSDGFLVLKAIAMIFKDYKPLAFFSVMAGFFALLSILAGLPPIIGFIETHKVERFPLAILASGLGVLAALSLAVGLILDTVAKFHHENFELWRRQLKK